MSWRPPFRCLLPFLTALPLLAQTPETSFEFAATQPSLPPRSEFYGSIVYLPETNAIVSLQITRMGPTNNSATVQLILTNESALAGEHFQLLQPTLNFAPAETNKSL